MNHEGFDAWWWKYCEREGMDASKRSPIIKDIWARCQVELDEAMAKIEPEINELKERANDLAAQNDNLKKENAHFKFQVEQGKEEILDLKNEAVEAVGNRFDNQSDLKKMTESLKARPSSTVKMEEISYRSLGIMLSTIWVEYLVRGLGFGVGISLVLGMIRAMFHVGLC